MAKIHLQVVKAVFLDMQFSSSSRTYYKKVIINVIDIQIVEQRTLTTLHSPNCER